MGKKDSSDPVLACNRRARHDYEILERLETGIKLTGTEVKSCRARNVSLAEAYVDIDRGQLFLVNAHIAVYREGNIFNHHPRQKRRLLVHKKEIRRLAAAVEEKGMTLIPLSLYSKKALIKLEIALCRGKTHADRREDLRKRQDEMDMRRMMGR